MKEMHEEAANTAERTMDGMSACHRDKTRTHKKSKRYARCPHASDKSNKQEQARQRQHTLLPCDQETPTHALIGRQRGTCGMQKNHNIATHTQTTVGDTDAAAKPTPTTANEVHMSLWIPLPPQQPTTPPFFCVTGTRRRGGIGPRERGSRQGKIRRHTEGRKGGREKCTPGRRADQRRVEERVKRAATQKEEGG